jgi:predicted transcriptional regulator
MNIVTLELLAGPAPTHDDPKEHAIYALRRARVHELDQRLLLARYVRMARNHGLSNREIGEVLGHAEGWVRQYLKDTEGKKDPWDFADSGFRGFSEVHNLFWKDMTAASGLDQQLHLCAERGLSDGAVAAVLCIPHERASALMEGPRAEAAA